MLSPQAFRTFLASRPAAAMAHARACSAGAFATPTPSATGFASLTTLGRVAERLLELADRFGIEDDGCVRIELRLSQEELAGWTGASLESVGRALATMRSLHWIETRRREIRILDVEALRRATA